MSVVKVKTSNKKYDVIIEQGMFSKIAREIRKIYSGKRLFLVTDENIASIYEKDLLTQLEKEEFFVVPYIIKPGESSKALSYYEEICEYFVEQEITSADLIVAFGGGVVGDLTGFVAATLKRGISYIQIPTSVIAQVDSSVGGKIGLNLKNGKNFIGAFYHPKRVLIDPQLLNTLQEKYQRDGMAEIIKYALIKDHDLFLALEMIAENRWIDQMEEISRRCLQIKADLVQKDERDRGDRMLLNFGHTLGHAVETEANYERYSHGEAVAIGMSVITERSEKMGFTRPGTHDRIVSILKKYRLPYQVKDMNREGLLQKMYLDKKVSGDFIHLVLLRSIGEGFIHKIDREELKDFF